MRSLFFSSVFWRFVAGYCLYARSINRSVIKPDDKKATPAKMYMDGVDFTPANRNVLFGYQFKSIAALGPILGPIIAVQWGWLPGPAVDRPRHLLHRLGARLSSIIMGVREEGQSFGALSYRLISPRSRGILITFIYFYLWLIMGSFGVQVGFNLLTNPAVPLGVHHRDPGGHPGRPDDLQVEAGHHPHVRGDGGAVVPGHLAGHAAVRQEPLHGDPGHRGRQGQPQCCSCR